MHTHSTDADTTHTADTLSPQMHTRHTHSPHTGQTLETQTQETPTLQTQTLQTGRLDTPRLQTHTLHSLPFTDNHRLHSFTERATEGETRGWRLCGAAMIVDKLSCLFREPVLQRPYHHLHHQRLLVAPLAHLPSTHTHTHTQTHTKERRVLRQPNSTARHSTAPHGTAQHRTAQHSTSIQDKNTKLICNMCLRATLASCPAFARLPVAAHPRQQTRPHTLWETPESRRQRASCCQSTKGVLLPVY